MKAQIKNNLLDIIDNYFAGTEGHRESAKFLALCERIEGQVVELIFSGPDAFEKEDGDFWLPACCWDEVDG